jgi:hypothetical protein
MITATIETATVELVDGLLERNTNNRAMRKSTVLAYESEIKSGHWILTNQGIGVDVNGILVDGQHRLQAIKNCGYPPIKLLIVRGLAQEASAVVDQQSKRDIRDAIFFATGTRVSRCAPAICRVIFAKTKKEPDNIRTQATVHQVTDIMAKYKDELDKVIHAPHNEQSFAAPHYAAFVIAAHETGRVDDVCSFIRSVEGGENLTKKMPAWHLNNYMHNGSKAGGGGSQQSERYDKTYRATIAHLAGQEMGVLRA